MAKRNSPSSELATKSYLDLKFDAFERRIEEKMEEKLVNFRDKILNSIDKVMGELQAMREENTIGTYHTRELRGTVEDHEKRIAKLETPQTP